MKKVFWLSCLCFCFSTLSAQLPTGSIATDFNVVDINGNQHHLYSYLNQGKTVILDFSAAWCPLCWSYHNSKALSDFYTLYGPDGTDEAMVLFIERDEQMGLADLRGETNASTGDWITGTPYPIIDTSGLNDAYRPNALPTIMGVHPDRVVTNLGTRTADELLDFVRAFEPQDSMPVDTMIMFSIRSLRDVTCFGFSDGSIDIDVEGPAFLFDYQWSNGDTTQDISNLAPGEYSCTVTDNLGNTFTSEPIAVNQPDQLAVTFLSNTPSSSTATDGSLIANVAGGVPPYSYIWDDSSTMSSREGIGEGNYSVAVTDANGCTTSNEFELVVPVCALFLAINVQPTTCDENSDGQVNLLVERAQGQITYAWNTGDSTQNLVGLMSGGYEVTVTDAMGCSAIAAATVTIDDPVAPVARIRDDFFEVYLGEDGIGFLTPEQVDSGSFDNCALLAIQLTQEEFTCDHIGLNFIEFAAIDEALNMTRRDIEVSVLDTLSPRFLCEDTVQTFQACNGVVHYDEPVILDNCPFGSTMSLTGLGSGSIFPVGTSTETFNYLTADGLRATCSIDIVVESWITADVVVNDASCPGEDDGSATVIVANGSPNYSYAWSDGQTTGAAIGLAAGSYSVDVVDSMECQFSFDFFVGEPVEIFARVDSIVIPDGVADVFVSVFGGTPPYRYQWIREGETIATVQDPQNMEPGSYQLDITDANDCLYTLFGVQVGSGNSSWDLELLAELRLAPNPNQGQFVLEFPPSVHGRTGHLRMYNMLGQRVHDQTVSMQAQVSVETQLQPGIFLVEVIHENSRVVRRMHVQ